MKRGNSALTDPTPQTPRPLSKEFIQEDPVNVIWCLVGIFVWPELTFAIILWQLGHPVLGTIAFFVTEFTSNIKTVVKERFIDARTGNVIKETSHEE